MTALRHVKRFLLAITASQFTELRRYKISVRIYLSHKSLTGDNDEKCDEQKCFHD